MEAPGRPSLGFTPFAPSLLPSRTTILTYPIIVVCLGLLATSPPCPGSTSDARRSDWLKDNDAKLVQYLADLVAIHSISTDGEHQKEIDRTADADLRADAAGGPAATSRSSASGDSYPYAYGEWLDAPGKPTVFLYAHHDVQPVNFVEQWQSPTRGR